MLHLTILFCVVSLLFMTVYKGSSIIDSQKKRNFKKNDLSNIINLFRTRFKRKSSIQFPFIKRKQCSFLAKFLQNILFIQNKNEKLTNLFPYKALSSEKTIFQKVANTPFRRHKLSLTKRFFVRCKKRNVGESRYLSLSKKRRHHF